MLRTVKVLLIFLLISLLFTAGCSQKKAGDLYTVGICQYTANPLLDNTREGFIQAFEDAGFEDGKNIKFDFRDAQGDMGTTQLIIQNFIQEKVDMICAISTPSLQTAIHNTEEIPIIFGAIANPYRVGAGEDSLNHRSNVTGASAPSPIRKGMEMVLKLLPDAKRVGTLWNPAEENSHYDMERARKIADDLGLELVELPVSSSSEVYMSAQVLAEKGIDAFMQILDLAYNLAHTQFSLARDGQAGRIIPSVLQPAQHIHQQPRGLPVTDVPYNGAHVSINSCYCSFSRPSRYCALKAMNFSIFAAC